MPVFRASKNRHKLRLSQSNQLREIHREDAGPSERIGPSILRLDRRLRFEIGVDSTKRIVASHASHDDVAFPDRSFFVHRQRPTAF